MSETDRRLNLLHLRLLGGFDLQSSRAGVAIPAGRKVRALLGCLALPPGSVWPRERLMALLWSDRSDEQARASLRQALAEMRRVLGEPSPLRTEHDTVSLDPALITVDAVEFVRLAKANKPNEAATLYRGQLLDGHGVRDGAFEDWIRVERLRLHDLAVDVLDRFAASQSGDAAVATAQRLLQLDPAREATHRLLMRLYAAVGQRAQALRQYQQCRDTLQRELQTQPDIETERLHRQIHGGTIPTKATRADPAKPDRAAQLDSRLSIAVLPFTNLSADPEQQYFSDGITEDIITELSRFRQLFVIARNSSFQFRGPTIDLADVKRGLGVQYVVEGSVRKSSDVVRIAAQLIDVDTGKHVWAERYDRKFESVFLVQDEVVHAVAATVEGRLVPSGAERALRKPTPNMTAYDYLLQGREHWNHYDGIAAEVPLRRAIDLDPRYAQAHAWLAASLLLRSYLLDDELCLEPALACAQKAVDLDPDDSMTHRILGSVLTYVRKHDAAAAHFDRAINLNPNDMQAQTLYANLMIFMGQPAAALTRLALVLQRDPYPPLWYWESYGMALYHLRRYDDAVAAFHKVGLRHPWTHADLAAGYAMAGRIDDVAEHMAAFVRLWPSVSLRDWATSEPYKDKASLDHLLDGLRKAGLPE